MILQQCQIPWNMLVRTVGMNATKNKENVTGVVLKATVVEKIGRQEMGVMAHLAEQQSMNVH